MPRAAYSIISQPGKPGSMSLLCSASSPTLLQGKARGVKPSKDTQRQNKTQVDGQATTEQQTAKSTAPQAGNSLS